MTQHEERLNAAEDLRRARADVHPKLMAFADGKLSPMEMRAFAAEYARAYRAVAGAAMPPTESVATYVVRLVSNFGVKSFRLEKSGSLLVTIHENEHVNVKLVLAEALLADAISPQAGRKLAPLFARSQWPGEELQITSSKLRAFVGKHDPKLLLALVGSTR